MKRSYDEIKEGVRTICSKYSLNDMKKANKEVRTTFEREFDGMFKVETSLETTMYYDFIDNEDDEIRIGFDFWNRKLVC